MHETLRRWVLERRITSRELAWVIQSAPPLCFEHTTNWLEDRAEGAGRRIRGDRTWDRKGAKGMAVIAAMRRAGLIKFAWRAGRPSSNKQCTARSKRSGVRCKAWRKPGFSVCYHHGAHRTRKPGDQPFAAHTALKLERTLAKMAERQRRKAEGVLPAGVGFKPAPPDEAPLEREFKSPRKPKLGPLY